MDMQKREEFIKDAIIKKASILKSQGKSEEEIMVIKIHFAAGIRLGMQTESEND